MILRIKYDDTQIGEMPYPNKGVEKFGASHSINLRDEELNVSDSVDCYYQEQTFDQAWYRGYVANIIKDGNSWDVMY